MKQPTTNSARSFFDAPVSVTEIIEVPPTSSITAKDEEQQATTKSTKHCKFPLRIGSKKQQPHTPQNNIDELYQIKPKPIESNVHSLAEDKLEGIIEDLNENPPENEAFEEKPTWRTTPFKWINRSREFTRHIMEQPRFHYGIIVLVIVDLIIVFIELTIEQLSAPCLTEEEMKYYNTTEQRKECLIPPTPQLETGETVLFYISFIILCIFVLEVLTAFHAFGWRRYTKILFLLDAIIVLASFIMEVYFHFGSATKAGESSAALVVLRMWKVVRAIHAIAHSISLRNHMIVEKIKEAEAVLHEEIRVAETTIYEQKIKINDLTMLLEKQDIQTTSDETTDEFLRKGSASFTTVTQL